MGLDKHARKAFFGAVAVCVSMLSASVATAQDISLEGTKKGPTGYFMTMEERAALRERVRNEAWAKEYFEKEILPACDKPQGAFTGEPMAMAIAYTVTGDKSYAKRIRDRMVYRFNRWNNQTRLATWGDGKKKPGAQFAYGIGSMPDWIPRAYDLIADALSDEDELLVRRGIKEQIECARNYCRKYWIHTENIKMCGVCNFAPWACAVGDDDYLEWLLHHLPNKPEGAKKHGGFVWLMDRYIRDAGRPLCFGNETASYSWIFSNSLPKFADAMRRYSGEDFYQYRTKKGATIKKFIDGVIATAYPVEETGIGKGSVRVANWGSASTGWGPDAGDVFLVNCPWGYGRLSYPDTIKSLARAYPEDSRYRWYLSLLPDADKPDMDDFLYGRLDISAPTPSAPCRLFPESGIAMLRIPETPKYWRDGVAAFLHGGEKSRSNFNDPLLLLHGAGRLLYPDWEATCYEPAWPIGWGSKRLSSNTLVIDGRDGLASSSTWRHSFAPEVKFASARCHPYLEAEVERALMLTHEYLLDIINARVLPKPADRDEFNRLGGSVYWDGNASLSEDLIVHPGQNRYDSYWRARKMPKSHTFDYMLHGIGRQFPGAGDLYHESSDFRTSFWPNRWVERERSRRTHAGFLVDWVQTSAGLRTDVGGRNRWQRLGPEWYGGRAGVRMRMLGQKGTTVFLGEGPTHWGVVDRDMNPEEALPFVAVRRTGKRALFVALHEPYKPVGARHASPLQSVREPYRKSPAIHTFSYVCRPKAEDANPVVGVEVKGPDYTDRLFICLGLDGLKIAPSRSKVENLLANKRELADITEGWLFKTDPEQVGDAKGWAAPSFRRDDWRKVSVQTGWQKFQPGYYGTAWYARTFTVPAGARKRKPSLFFIGADQDAWIYLNGKLVKEHHKWDEPFFVDLGDAVKYDGENLVVAKIRKLGHQTGLYGGVKLVTEDGSEPGHTGSARGDPLVTARSEVDPTEAVRFKGQAYFRVTRNKMMVRGDVESFSLAAPGVREVVLNGKEVTPQRRGAYIIYGKAPFDFAQDKPVMTVTPLGSTVLFPGESVPVEVEVRNPTEKPARNVKVRLALPEGLEAEPKEANIKNIDPFGTATRRFNVKAKPDAKVGAEQRVRATAGNAGSAPFVLTVSSPVAISLPQRCVNLDAETGGTLLVRIENVSARPVSGRLLLGKTEGLVADRSEAQIQRLAPREKREVAFELKPHAKFDGKLVPTTVRFASEAGNETRRIDTRVAVGVVVQEVAETYADRVNHNKFHTDVYERFRVRAPGYTIEVDKTSGTCRWVMDPQGKVRTSLGWYPFRKSRGHIPYTYPKRESLAIPTVWDLGKRKKVFDWNQKAVFVGQTAGAEGEPTLTFRTADDKHALIWYFLPDRVKLEVPVAEGQERTRMDLSKLDVDETAYKYRIEKSRDGFGFQPRAALPAPKPEPKAAAAPAEKKRLEEPVNVIENGDFARLVPDKMHPSGTFPAGWKLNGPRGKPADYSLIELDEKVCVSGGRSLKLRLNKFSGVQTFLVQQGIPVKANHLYNIRIRMRHEKARNTPGKIPHAGAMGTTRVFCTAPGASSIVGIGYNASCWQDGTRDWFVQDCPGIGRPDKRRGYGPITKDGTMSIRIQLPYYPDMDGTLWIDEIMVEETPPAP